MQGKDDDKLHSALSAKQPDEIAKANERSSNQEVEAFLSKLNALSPAGVTGKRGRLIFAMDATMSRQPTWDMALAIQADMFSVVKALGGLDIQLVYFRGFDECRSSKWANNAETLSRLMTSVSCQGGYTQIGKVLKHARKENEKEKIGALVYVGDCVEEQADDLCHIAGELGLLGIPVFVFQEGHDPNARMTFEQIAKLSGGAYSRFNAGAADELRALLSAVAVYATGGRAALENMSREGNSSVRALLEQMN